MSFISLHNVDVEFPLKEGGSHRVFSGLNLQIEKGEFVSVIGQTGCGKSTLLRLLLGSERPQSGRVVVDGQLVFHPSRDRGYVPQKYSLFPDKTVIQNIAFGPIAESFALHRLFTPSWWKHRKEIYEEAFSYLRRVGLAERDARKYPDQLSGGMQQRVAIAQSLIMRPKILLMDESFSALDPATRTGMQRLIRSIWQGSGTTIVFVTHNLAEAVYLGSRVLLIAKDLTQECSQIALDLRVPDCARRADGTPRPEELERITSQIEYAALGKTLEEIKSKDNSCEVLADLLN
jgi:NitT/TauT family transport system ATP-binding protein